MKKILLTKGLFALVDNEDFDYLNKWKWYASHGKYAARQGDYKIKPRKEIRMATIVNKTPAGFETDHINGNTLDNRRGNLRTATHSENMKNTHFRKDNTSGYKGVFLDKRPNKIKKWQSYIVVDKKRIFIGLYTNPLEAAKAYDQAAIVYHRDFAKLNFPLTSQK